MSSEVNGISKFYLFIAQNFGSTENMVTSMDNNSDGYLIKAEFTKYMKENWAGNFTDSELNQFWAKFDKTRDGKLDGTNLRNLNALDETELRNLEAQITVYNEIREYIEDKLKAYQSAIAEFGIPFNQFSNSVKESLFNQIAGYIDANAASSTLMDDLKNLVDTNIETAVNKTAANLYAHNYLKAAIAKNPELRASGYQGDDDLENIISAYVLSGNLSLDRIKSEVEQIINAYLSTATANPTTLTGSLAAYNWSGYGLNGAQTAVISNKIKNALGGEAARFANMQDEFYACVQEFLQNKINSGLSFAKLYAMSNEALLAEFKASNQYKALEVLVNYADINAPSSNSNTSRTNSNGSNGSGNSVQTDTALDSALSGYSGTETISSGMTNSSAVINQKAQEAKTKITAKIEDMASSMISAGLDTTTVNSVKTNAIAYYTGLIDKQDDINTNGIRIVYKDYEKPDREVLAVTFDYAEVAKYLKAQYKLSADKTLSGTKSVNKVNGFEIVNDTTFESMTVAELLAYIKEIYGDDYLKRISDALTDNSPFARRFTTPSYLNAEELLAAIENALGKTAAAKIRADVRAKINNTNNTNNTYTDNSAQLGGQLYNKISARYSKEFADYIALHDTDPDYGYIDVVKSVAQMVASGQLSTEEQIQDAIVNGLSKLYAAFMSGSNPADPVNPGDDVYYADWKNTTIPTLMSGTYSGPYDFSAKIMNGTSEVTASSDNKITYSISNEDGCSASITGLGQVSVKPTTEEGYAYFNVNILLNGNVIGTKKVTITVEKYDFTNLAQNIVSGANWASTDHSSNIELWDNNHGANFKDGVQVTDSRYTFSQLYNGDAIVRLHIIMDDDDKTTWNVEKPIVEGRLNELGGYVVNALVGVGLNRSILESAKDSVVAAYVANKPDYHYDDDGTDSADLSDNCADHMAMNRNSSSVKGKLVACRDDDDDDSDVFMIYFKDFVDQIIAKYIDLGGTIPGQFMN